MHTPPARLPPLTACDTFLFLEDEEDNAVEPWLSGLEFKYACLVGGYCREATSSQTRNRNNNTNNTNNTNTNTNSSASSCTEYIKHIIHNFFGAQFELEWSIYHCGWRVRLYGDKITFFESQLDHAYDNTSDAINQDVGVGQSIRLSNGIASGMIGTFEFEVFLQRAVANMIGVVSSAALDEQFEFGADNAEGPSQAWGIAANQAHQYRGTAHRCLQHASLVNPQLPQQEQFALKMVVDYKTFCTYCTLSFYLGDELMRGKSESESGSGSENYSMRLPVLGAGETDGKWYPTLSFSTFGSWIKLIKYY